MASVLLLGGVRQGTASTFLTYLWETDPATKQRRASYIRLCANLLYHFIASHAETCSIDRAGCSWWRTTHLPYYTRSCHSYRVDKALIIPQSDLYLKWIDPAARKLLKDNCGKGIDYIQGNLANEETRKKVFLAPNGKAFDIVFDLSQGDASVAGSDEVLIEVSRARLRPERPSLNVLCFQAVAKQARLLGLEALKHGGVGAYVRQTDRTLTAVIDR